MNLTWHEAKRAANLRKHGFDFADAAKVFDGPTITAEDPRDYGGEQRFNTTGMLGANFVTICHTESETTIRIISMRKAGPHEIDEFARYT